MDEKKLVEEAKKARENAYAPYSGFKVGAAVLSSNGKVYRGCNVENASYGTTMCAERNAIGCAVADGKKEFTAIAVVSDRENGAAPCGECRQALAEFAKKKDIRVIIADLKGKFRAKGIRELLPEAFEL